MATRHMCSAAAVNLLRALIERAGCDRAWVLTSDIQSTDWQSVTFTGERHRIELRLLGVGPGAAAARLVSGLEDAEFNIPGHTVADVAVTAGPTVSFDGSVTLTIEALTIED